MDEKRKRMTRWGWISIAWVIVAMAWPLIVLWNTSERIVPATGIVYLSLALIVLNCVTAGLWRVIVGLFVGGYFGLVCFGLKVNGSGLQDVQSAIGGAVIGTLLGYAWHESRRIKPPALTQGGSFQSNGPTTLRRSDDG